MPRKIVWISSILMLLPSLAFSQVDLALKIGAGMMHPGATSDRHLNFFKLDRYRILLGLDGVAKLYEQQNAFLNLKAETEFSYLWYDYEDRDDMSRLGDQRLIGSIS